MNEAVQVTGDPGDFNTGPVIRADVLIIGGGPAGVAAALALRQRGVAKVAIIEREKTLGGIPRHCGHPPFGMREFGRILSGPAYARRLAQAAADHGVSVHTGTTVVRMNPGARLDIVNAQGRGVAIGQRVIIATGVRETPRAARLVSGDRPVGVLNTGALQAYLYLQHLQPFQRPVIVGTELVSVSALLSCRKAGIRPVAIIESRGRPTTYKPFMWLARWWGVPVFYSTQIDDILGQQRVSAVRMRHGDGTQRELACDGVLFTGGFTPEAALVRDSHLKLNAATQGPQVDQYGRCSDPTYFAAGNVLRALETAGWSFREGRRIGLALAGELAVQRIGAAETGVREIDIKADAAAGTAIRLVMPQRLRLPVGTGGLTHLQLRAERAVKGLLTVSDEHGVVWQKAVSLLPERRILIPLKALRISDKTTALRVAVLHV